MKFVIARKDARRILKWTRYSLFAGSASLFGYCGWVSVDAWTFQRDEHIQLERRLLDQPSVAKPETEIAPVTPLPVSAGDPIGRVVIERLGISVVVAEGTNRLTLRRAVGHIPGTALPGQPGNTAIFRASRHILSAAPKRPAERHHRANNRSRRVPLSCRVHQNCRSQRRERPRFERNSGPDAGHLLSVLLRWPCPRSVHRASRKSQLVTLNIGRQKLYFKPNCICRGVF
jgi:hypothetical protein